MKDFIDFLKSRTFFANLFLALVILLVVSLLAFKYLAAATGHGESIEVPQLVNKSFEEASRLLEESELEFLVIDTVYEEDRPKGIVIEQKPEAFSRVKEGRTIYITINARNAPKVEMPDLVNQSLRQATYTLNALGIKFETDYRPDICTDCVLEQLYRGTVIRPGTPIAKGETVLLILGVTSGTTPEWSDTLFDDDLPSVPLPPPQPPVNGEENGEEEIFD